MVLCPTGCSYPGWHAKLGIGSHVSVLFSWGEIWGWARRDGRFFSAMFVALLLVFAA